MSYTAYFSRQSLQLPGALGVSAALWLYINVFNGKPAVFTRQISKAEFNATPTNYLMHPDHNHVAFPKVPGQATIPDGLAELEHRKHAKAGAAHH